MIFTAASYGSPIKRPGSDMNSFCFTMASCSLSITRGNDFISECPRYRDLFSDSIPRQKEWNVPAKAELKSLPDEEARRSRISSAAFLLKVRISRFSGWTLNSTIVLLMRSIMVRVFPVPGPAMTRWIPFPGRDALVCCMLKFVILLIRRACYKRQNFFILT